MHKAPFLPSTSVAAQSSPSGVPNLSWNLFSGFSSSSIETYADLLRSSYVEHHLFPPDQWPPRLSECYINLALIQHEAKAVDSSSSLNDFEKTTLHGTVDDLCFRKYSIKLHEILAPTSFFEKKEEVLKEERELVFKQMVRLINQPMPDALRSRLGIPKDSGEGLPRIDDIIKQPKFLREPRLHKRLANQPPQEEAVTGHPTPGHAMKVLIAGAPGVGKTTLTWKVSQDWAKGELFKDCKMVIRVSLRDLPEDPTSIWQLFPVIGSVELRQSVEQQLLNTNGKDTVFILDGWDELSLNQRKRGSLLYQIVRGDILPQCTVIITSRPYTSRWLQLPSMVPRHIELFGFTQEQIQQCIRSEFKSSPASAEQLVQLLEVRTEIFKMCYIPNNLSIVVNIFRTSENTLPTTLTQLFKLYVHSALVRYLQFQSEDPEAPLSMDASTQFPPHIQELYASLCSLALQGLLDNKMVFQDKDLEKFNPLLVQKANTLGLMTAYKYFTPYGIKRVFQFIHTTIQEFLAAVALTQNLPDNQMALILRHINISSQFRMVLIFFAGLVGLRGLESLFSVPVSYKGYLNIDRLLLLVRMLYEAQNPQLCNTLAQSFPNGSLELSRFVSLEMMIVDEFDLYMLRYFLRHCSLNWQVVEPHQTCLLSLLEAITAAPGSSIEELHINSTATDAVYSVLLDGQKRALQHLKAVRVNVDSVISHSASTFFSSDFLTHLHFDCSSQEALESVAAAASRCPSLMYLGLKTIGGDFSKRLSLSVSLPIPSHTSDNFHLYFEKFSVTDEFVSTVCHSLATSSSLKKLHFKDCILSEHQMQQLFIPIQSNSSLLSFHISQPPSSKVYWNTEIAGALQNMVETNASITSLQLSQCSLSGTVSLNFAQALKTNRSITSIDLSSNANFFSSREQERDFFIALQLNRPSQNAIEVLKLRSCKLNEQICCLAEFISSDSCTLKELDLSFNSIREESGNTLFKAVSRNKSLKLLNMTNNPLWLSTGESLQTLFEDNCTLEQLILCNCGLHLPALQGLGSGISKNTTLARLELGVYLKRTPVDGACVILDGLRKNTGLTTLSLSGYEFCDQGTLALASSLEENSSLVSLILLRCSFGSAETINSVITSLYSHKTLREISVPATNKVFNKLFSKYDHINYLRSKKNLPYLTVTESSGTGHIQVERLLKNGATV